MDKKIKIVGHRGVAALRPENTMASFAYAMKLGLYGIETDIRMSSDGELVLIHDARVDRTTNGSGNVCDFTLKQLKELDAGSWFSKEFAGQKILTFEEFLEQVSDKNIFLNIEIKDEREIVTEKTIKMLEKYNISKEDFVITSFHPTVTNYAIKKYNLHTQGFPLSYYPEENRPESYDGFYSIGINMNDLTKELCDTLQEQNVEPWCWCPDTKEQVEFAIACGSPLATVNNPLPALELLNNIS